MILFMYRRNNKLSGMIVKPRFADLLKVQNISFQLLSKVPLMTIKNMESEPFFILLQGRAQVPKSHLLSYRKRPSKLTLGGS
jgi:hypothetical protein